MPLQIAALDRVFGKSPVDSNWSFADATTTKTNYLTHGYHRYPAKFIPQIVQKLIGMYGERGGVIFDPFGGCGTTLVEAKTLGYPSIGFDINPVAKFITQVKLTPIHPLRLEKSLARFERRISKLYGQSTTTVHHPRIFYWFDENTIRKLDSIYSAVLQISDYQIRKFYLCSFSHILKSCSIWLSKSIKPTRDLNKTIPDPLQIFRYHLSFMMKHNRAFYEKLSTPDNLRVPAKMYLRDSTKTFPIGDNSVNLIITSPPYVTSYEYADLHQLTLLWLGEGPTHFKSWGRHLGKFDEFRKNFVGTSLKKSNTVSQREYGSKLAGRIVSDLMDADRSLAVDVSNYYYDMRKVFTEMYRVLRPGSKACVIIGNTVLKGIGILNAEVCFEQMLQNGFKVSTVVKRAIHNKGNAPLRDIETGKFTGHANVNRRRIYEHEFIIVMEKGN